MKPKTARELERGTPEYYADMLVTGHTGGVDVAVHNLAVIKLAMKAGSIAALDELIKDEKSS